MLSATRLAARQRPRPDVRISYDGEVSLAPSCCWLRGRLLCLEAGLLDDRPPLFDLGLLASSKGLRRLLLTRKNLHTDVGKTRTDRCIGQPIGDRCTELSDNFLWRSLWRPKTTPARNVEPRQSGLIHSRNVGRSCQPALCCNGVALDVSGTHLRHSNGRTVYDHVNLTGHQSLH